MNVKLIIATIFYLDAIWKEFLPLLPFISLLYCKEVKKNRFDKTVCVRSLRTYCAYIHTNTDIIFPPLHRWSSQQPEAANSWPHCLHLPTYRHLPEAHHRYSRDEDTDFDDSRSLKVKRVKDSDVAGNN